jgi:hypothetical protein
MGGGYLVATNFNVDDWGLNESDTLDVYISGYSESLAVSSGQMFMDNYEVVTLPGISNHLYEVEIDQALEYRDPRLTWDDTYDFWMGILTDTSVSNIHVQCPGGESFSITNSSPDEGNLYWEYGDESPSPFLSQFGDGDYIINLVYSNATTQSTVIPFTQNDGTTPIPTVEDQPMFTSPAPLHGTLFASPQPNSLTWANIDPDANAIEIESRMGTDPWGDSVLIGYYTDTVPVDEVSGPLSTRYVDGLSFTPTNWVVSICVNHEAWGTNSDGVEYSCAKGADTVYHFTVSPSISEHLYYVEINAQYDYTYPDSPTSYDFEFEAVTDASVTNVHVNFPNGGSTNISTYGTDEGDRVWYYGVSDSSPNWYLFGDGGYTVTLTYSDGLTQSTTIPFAQEDGETPIPAILNEPLFSSPSPFHDALFVSSQPISLVWTNIDPNANTIVLLRSTVAGDDEELLGVYSDIAPGADGPLSTRSYPPLSFTTNNWEVELVATYYVEQTNSDGVAYFVNKLAESDHQFIVVDPDDDFDSDGLPNWWETLYFDGPTNAIASVDSDLDGHDNIREMITGMDPTDSNSVFMITNSVTLADDFLIEWMVASGRVYNVNWTTNLMDEFQPLETDIFYPRNSYTDTVHGAESECFYQVDVRME